MTLVHLVDPGAADATIGPLLESGRSQYGTVLHTWRALAHRPPIFEAYLPYLRAVVGPGEVPERTKNLAAIEVAIRNHCRYSASHRAFAARANGVTDADLDALARGDLDGFVPAERLAIEFARELTLRPIDVRFADVPQAVDADLLARLRATFSEAALVELSVCISLWNALARFHRVMGLPLDLPPPPAAVDAAL
jgi:AhpD family alkylhydroperoxidase